jgi:NAD(P)-dependent dehydrogenase (short-subunit alcohol dehydrogenase family)
VATFAELHDLTGKAAVVTGGSRGIGRAIVQILAEAGADVVIASRKLDACEQAAAQVRASTGSKAVPVACHVGRWQDCDRLIAEALARLGGLDVLVNNAGMSPLYESLDAVTEDLFDKTLAVNLKGPFRLAVLAATHMAARDGGSIINIGTTGSLTASTRELPYACAKAGLNALTVGLADAYAPKVRVNAILPGPFRTDISKAWAPPEGAEVPFVPLGRMGEPAEVAPLALHLASAASSFTTGAVIRVDGGVTRKVLAPHAGLGHCIPPLR